MLHLTITTLFLILAYFSIARGLNTGLITTIAGTGSYGSTGDGGLATVAKIGYPAGLNADAAGDLYFADYSSHCVRKIAVSTGIITNFAGTTRGYSGDNGQATSAQLNAPYGVCANTAGNVFIADTENHRIRKVAVGTGVVTTIAGTGTIGFSGDSGQGTSAKLNSPSGLCSDTSGNLYIADRANYRVRKLVLETGVITTIAGTGSAGYSGDNGQATSAKLAFPTGLSVDTSGSLYIADMNNNCIRKVALATGVITTIAGTGIAGYSGDLGLAAMAQLKTPSGVSSDTSGNIFIADKDNNRVRKVVVATGVITTIAGTGVYGYFGDNGQAINAQLNNPSWVNADNFGNLYICDVGNNRVRKVTILELQSTFIPSKIPTFLPSIAFPAKTKFWQTNSVTITVSYSASNTNTAQQNYFIAGPYSICSTFTATMCASGGSFVGDTYLRLVDGIGTTLVIDDDGCGGSGGSKVVFTPTSCMNVTLRMGCYNAGDCSGTVAITGFVVDTPSQVPTYSPATTLEPTYIPTISQSPTTSLPTYSPTNALNINPTFSPSGLPTFPPSLLSGSMGIISTIAGTGTAGYSGDNGLATSAQLQSPRGVLSDTSGNVYIADSSNHRIRKVDTNGVITTIVGTGTVGFGGDNGQATSAQLNFPLGVSTDTLGNVFISDYNNNRIRKVVLSTGVITTIAGNGQQGYSGDNGQATSARLNNPSGVSVDSLGNLFIADTFNNRIRKVLMSTGVITSIAGDGTAGYSGDGGLATSAQLNLPFGVTTDASGNIFIADYGNHIIRKIVLATGVIISIAGSGTGGYSGDNGQAASAQLNFPFGVTMDASGNIFIADYGNNRIRKVVSSTGVITTVAGSGSTGFSGDSGQSTNAQLNNPSGVSADTFGKLYICDAGNNRVRGVTIIELQSTIAPSAEPTFLPSASPSNIAPSRVPSTGPSIDPSFIPTISPSFSLSPITSVPTYSPTNALNINPTLSPSFLPSLAPSNGAAALITISMMSQFGTSGDDILNGVAVDGGGNNYVAGSTSGSFAGQANSGFNDGFVSKLDDSGALLWTKQFGTAGNDYINGIAVDSSANSYVCGYTSGVFAGQASAGSNDGFVSKLDASGELIWTIQFGTAGNDYINGIAVDSSADSYVCGYTTGAFAGRINSGSNDGFVSKLDAMGAAIWTMQFGTTGNDFISGLAVDNTGNMHVCGYTSGAFAGQNSAGSNDGFVSRLDASGELLWTIQFGTTGNDFITGIASDIDYYSYVGGYTTGAFAGQTSSGSSDGFVSKLDGTGVLLWTKQFGTTGNDFISGIALNVNKTTYVCGYTTGAFGGQTSAGSYDGFISMLDDSGVVLMTMQFGTSGNDFINGIAADLNAAGHLAGYTTGAFLGETSAGMNDGFVAAVINPVEEPTFVPTSKPSISKSPSFTPSCIPTTPPSFSLSPTTSLPTYSPTNASNINPTFFPSVLPTFIPSFSDRSIGVITTVAGTGTAGYSGDNGQATNAQFNNPRGVTSDASGNIYIADFSNHRIRKVASATGFITTIAGTGSGGYSGDNGQATSAQLNFPFGVSKDPTGNIYIADFSNHRIRKVDALSGVITTVAGDGQQGFGGDNGLATISKINNPAGITTDSTGNIFISDYNNHRIRKVNVLTGIITTIAGTGLGGFSGDDGPATSAQLNGPIGVTTDASGNIFIADCINNRIRKIDLATGVIITIAGNGIEGLSGDDGQATSARLYNPAGVSVEGSGNLFIADYGNNRIRKVVSSTGVITTVAGSGSTGFSGDNGLATNAQLNNPSGVSVDSSGNLFIADASNYRIRKVIISPIPTYNPTTSPPGDPTNVPSIESSEAPSEVPSFVPTFSSDSPSLTPSYLSDNPADVPTSDIWVGPLSGTSGLSWNSITSDASGVNLAAGSSNLGIHYSRDGGNTWNISDGGYPTGQSVVWYSIASSSNGQVVAAGCYIYSDPARGELWVSINYGQSFLQGVAYNGMYQYFNRGTLAVSSDGTRVVASVNNLGVITYSINTGSGNISIVGTSAISGALTSDASFLNLAIGTNYGGIYLSNNSGSSWTKSNAPDGIQWNSLTSSANGQYLAAGTSDSAIYYSNDSGATWTQSSGASLQAGFEILHIASSASGQTMAAAMNDHYLHLSYDYGQSWQASYSVNSNRGGWVGLALSDDGGTIYSARHDGIYKSFPATAMPTISPTISMVPTALTTVIPASTFSSLPPSAFVFIFATVAAFLYTVYDYQSRSLSIWIVTPMVSYIASLVYVIAYAPYYMPYDLYIACSVITIAWSVVFVYELARIDAYPSKLFYHKEIRPKMIWLEIFDGYVVKDGVIKNKHFENHDNLGKLFYWLISWAFYLVLQLLCYVIYGTYLLLHVVYWTILLLIGMIIYNSHCFCSSAIWNTWLSFWTFSGSKFDSAVAIDTAFLNRSLMAQYLLHDVPMIAVMYLNDIEKPLPLYLFVLVCCNFLFIYRFVYYSISNLELIVSESPLVINVCGYKHLTSHESRGLIKRRVHRTSKEKKQIKSFLLDILMKAYLDKNDKIVTFFKDDRKIREIVIHERIDPKIFRELRRLGVDLTEFNIGTSYQVDASNNIDGLDLTISSKEDLEFQTEMQSSKDSGTAFDVSSNNPNYMSNSIDKNDECKHLEIDRSKPIQITMNKFVNPEILPKNNEISSFPGRYDPSETLEARVFNVFNIDPGAYIDSDEDEGNNSDKVVGKDGEIGEYEGFSAVVSSDSAFPSQEEVKHKDIDPQLLQDHPRIGVESLAISYNASIIDQVIDNDKDLGRSADFPANVSSESGNNDHSKFIDNVNMSKSITKSHSSNLSGDSNLHNGEATIDDFMTVIKDGNIAQEVIAQKDVDPKLYLDHSLLSIETEEILKIDNKTSKHDRVVGNNKGIDEGVGNNASASVKSDKVKKTIDFSKYNAKSDNENTSILSKVNKDDNISQGIRVENHIDLYLSQEHSQLSKKMREISSNNIIDSKCLSGEVVKNEKAIDGDGGNTTLVLSERDCSNISHKSAKVESFSLKEIQSSNENIDGDDAFSMPIFKTIITSKKDGSRSSKRGKSGKLATFVKDVIIPQSKDASKEEGTDIKPVLDISGQLEESVVSNICNSPDITSMGELHSKITGGGTDPLSTKAPSAKSDVVRQDIRKTSNIDKMLPIPVAEERSDQEIVVRKVIVPKSSKDNSGQGVGLSGQVVESATFANRDINIMNEKSIDSGIDSVRSSRRDKNNNKLTVVTKEDSGMQEVEAHTNVNLKQSQEHSQLGVFMPGEISKTSRTSKTSQVFVNNEDVSSGVGGIAINDHAIEDNSIQKKAEPLEISGNIVKVKVTEPMSESYTASNIDIGKRLYDIKNIKPMTVINCSKVIEEDVKRNEPSKLSQEHSPLSFESEKVPSCNSKIKSGQVVVGIEKVETKKEIETRLDSGFEDGDESFSMPIFKTIIISKKDGSRSSKRVKSSKLATFVKDVIIPQSKDASKEEGTDTKPVLDISGQLEESEKQIDSKMTGESTDPVSTKKTKKSSAKSDIIRYDNRNAPLTNEDILLTNELRIQEIIKNKSDKVIVGNERDVRGDSSVLSSNQGMMEAKKDSMSIDKTKISEPITTSSSTRQTSDREGNGKVSSISENGGKKEGVLKVKVIDPTLMQEHLRVQLGFTNTIDKKSNTNNETVKNDKIISGVGGISTKVSSKSERYIQKETIEPGEIIGVATATKPIPQSNVIIQKCESSAILIKDDIEVISCSDAVLELSQELRESEVTCINDKINHGKDQIVESDKDVREVDLNPQKAVEVDPRRDIVSIANIAFLMPTFKAISKRTKDGSRSSKRDKSKDVTTSFKDDNVIQDTAVYGGISAILSQEHSRIGVEPGGYSSDNIANKNDLDVGITKDVHGDGGIFH